MKKFLIIGLIILGSAFAYGYYLFHKPHQGISSKVADFKISSTELFNEYNLDESAANKKYLGKIVSVHGRVADKAYDAQGTMSLILEGGEMAGVGCQFDKSVQNEINKMKKGQAIKVKGRCTGMLMDVVLVDCVPDEDN